MSQDNDTSLDGELEFKYKNPKLQRMLALGLTKTNLIQMLPGDEPYKDNKFGDIESYENLM